MATKQSTEETADELARLARELERAEAYEQQLRQRIVEIKDQLAAGNTSRALSMLNETLNFIDSATDVVTSHPGA
jgi:predicted  nucleic acid-binding Zn-ribbon protein